MLLPGRLATIVPFHATLTEVARGVERSRGRVMDVPGETIAARAERLSTSVLHLSSAGGR